MPNSICKDIDFSIRRIKPYTYLSNYFNMKKCVCPYAHVSLSICICLSKCSMYSFRYRKFSVFISCASQLASRVQRGTRLRIHPAYDLAVVCIRKYLQNCIPKYIITYFVCDTLYHNITMLLNYSCEIVFICMLFRSLIQNFTLQCKFNGRTRRSTLMQVCGHNLPLITMM